VKRLGIGAAVLVMTGCTLEPRYHRPAVDVPTSFRGQETPATGAAATDLGTEHWWEVFQDPVLQQLIREALAHNPDLAIAAARVMEAQGELGVTAAQGLPSLSVGAGAFNQRVAPTNSLFPAYQAHAGDVDASLVWNLDFWGKYRSQTHAARAQLLASEWGRRAVLSSLIASVATAYFQLRELDLALEISRSTVKSRDDSLRLTRVLNEHGSAAVLDVRQAEELFYTATATSADLERQVTQQENALSILLGRNPGDIPRGKPLVEQPELPGVPAGLPSELLERRPDIRQAEETLIAANAQIGVARAAFFPSISLTGTAGYESPQLSQLFSTGSRMWDGAAALSQPIFEGGALRGQLKVAKAQHQEQVFTYQQTVQTAFRQVSDALTALQKNTEVRKQQQLLTDAARDADRLSHVLFDQGGASYLQVLTAETNYFGAQLNLAGAELNERLALVQLYNALGGGWND